jgi:WD40 repeat protein
MASTVTKTASTKAILKPSITLSHGDVESICYFPDGQRMISGSGDKTARQWDLKTGKEIEEARGVCEGNVLAVAVSRNGRWVATGSGRGELKACEVETGIVKTFKGHLDWINCIDISADNALLASGSWDTTARIWNLDTGKLVAGPFQSEDWVGAVRFSPDSKKLAVVSYWGNYLEVWDIQSQKLDVQIREYGGEVIMWETLVFWTNTTNIIAAFSFTQENNNIYEFDVSTLEIVGTPFKGHTKQVIRLALSFDQALLASASFDGTIKLWAFETRQLLASFDVQNISTLVLSPDSRQLAYTILNKDLDDHNIHICDIPPKILAQARVRILLEHVMFEC